MIAELAKTRKTISQVGKSRSQRVAELNADIISHPAGTHTSTAEDSAASATPLTRRQRRPTMARSV